MSGVVDKLRWSLQHRGVAGTLRAALSSLSRVLRPDAEPTTHPFDVEYGTDTGGLITGADLASGHASDRYIAGYAAVPPSRLRNILARWRASGPPYPMSACAFIDVGCGKGRAVLLASEYGFREVLGIELNPALAAVAQANAAIWEAAGRARCPIRIEQADALEALIPLGPCVIFLFNPFSEALMQRLASRLAVEFRDRPAELEILYYKPEHSSAFAGSFEMVWRERTEISQPDLDADPVADPQDETRGFRLVAQKMEMF